MEVTRQASSLCESLIEAVADGSRNLPHAQPVSGPNDEEPGGDAQEEKHIRLVPGRCDAEWKNAALLVPNAVLIGRYDTKSITSGTEARIEGLHAGADVLPHFINTVQLVTKFHSLRYRQAQCHNVI